MTAARPLASVPTPPPDTEDTPPRIDGGVAWEPPVPLTSVRELPAFPVEALPGWLADQVAAVAEATQTPPDLAGCIGLAALSTAAAGRATAAAGRATVAVRPGWTEPVNIYTVVVLPPSDRKTPVFQAMIAPIYTLERQLRDRAQDEIEQAKVQQRAAEALRERAEKTAVGKVGVERDEALEQAVNAALDAAAVTIPAQPKLVVDDITPETVASRLAEQGGRIAALSDEGGILATLAGRYSGVPNLDVFLKAYSGSQIRVDRGSRPDEFVERPALTLGLTIQPAVLDEIGRTSLLRGSGFFARILYSLPTSRVGHRIARPAPVPPEVEQTYHQRLHHLAYSLIDWTDPAVLTFASDADDAMAELQDDLETRLNPGAGAWAHIGDWGGKFHGQTARLAGLIHLATHPENPWKQPVAADTFTAARDLADYYAAHALATFDRLGADEALDDARHLLAWIERTRPASFTQRDAHISNRGRFKKAADLAPALALLEDHAHIQRQPTPERAPGQRGRSPSPTYWTHPTYRTTPE